MYHEALLLFSKTRTEKTTQMPIQEQAVTASDLQAQIAFFRANSDMRRWLGAE